MTSPQNWDLRIDEAIFKTLKKIPRRDAGVILEVIKHLPTNPYFGDIQKMKGEKNAWRRRVGTYRLFYKLDMAEKSILVFRVERRTSNTHSS
ncbi:MAG: type II toxin-antitoxin system RelE/ParE family toxin [bacterium]|nr:type II toxin-antitoxin system RelE/ParE family toxin [bacterium]